MPDRTISKSLPVPINDEERITYGKMTAELVAKAGAVECRKRMVNAQFKAETEVLTMEINRLSDILNSGEEEREVLCREVHDYNAGLVRVYRCDTTDLVDMRPMTSREMQQELPFVDHDHQGDQGQQGDDVDQGNEDAVSPLAAAVTDGEPLTAGTAT